MRSAILGNDLKPSLSSCPTLNVTLLSRHEFMEVTVGVFNGLGSNLRKRTYIYTLDIGLMLLMFNKAGLCFNKVIKYKSFSWFWVGCQMPHSGAVPRKQWWDLKPVLKMLVRYLKGGWRGLELIESLISNISVQYFCHFHRFLIISCYT